MTDNQLLMVYNCKFISQLFDFLNGGYVYVKFSALRAFLICISAFLPVVKLNS
ncbi:hypothetical protein SAMN04488104_10438 [Algoriphagus faecimaris]|uniref:Uncharacterized protein n=1 Tax=Algoriphagus faecimaris TaxID=686796 RepID=A0A1G6WEB0_9BACT|nr:hypothetical protein SAMN04488104_10438 [Algoriphagus faecimaris]